MGIVSNSSQDDSHCRESNVSMCPLILFPSSFELFFASFHSKFPLQIPLPPSFLTAQSFCFSASYSKPVVSLEPESNLRPGDKVALTCVAYGGYPQANVIWQDGSGRNLTDNITNSLVANEEGLFTMTSVLTVVLEPNSTYSCRLINPLLGEEGYAFVTITGG